MMKRMQYLFFSWTLFVSVLLISIRHHMKSKIEIIKGQKTMKTSITELGDNRSFIISSYYDSRGTKLVRVLAIIHHSIQELYCWFHCDHMDHVVIRAEIDLHRDRFGFPYGTADLLCPEPADCDYVFVSVHWSKTVNVSLIPKFEVKNHHPQPMSSNFTVCISTMFGDYKNVLQLIQSFEMYKLLGANRVTIYKNRCHESVEKVLQYYTNQGFLEVITWPIHRYLRTSDKWHYSLDHNSQVGYYGQTATLNDCIYRNMYKSKYVLLNDIDEIILPVKHQDWMSLMSSLQQQYPSTGVFRFENHVFPTHVISPNGDMWSGIPGVNILLHTYREPLIPNAFNDRKMIVDPRQVFQTSIHSTLKADGNSTDVPFSYAFTLHYRKTRRPDLAKDSLIKDNIIWRYNVSFVEKVNNVIQQIHEELM
ncbi:beta-1,4-galactosyltransferase galt-1-like [Discoglossus pictus]